MSPPDRHGFRWSVLATILIVTTVGIYFFVRYLSMAGPGFAGNRPLMLFLSSAIVMLVLGLASVLIRNLVRLIMDRKRGVLGARLRTKLVFFFLVLVLPPSLVLFYGSATIIKMTVEAVLKTPVESVTRYAQEIVNEWTDFIEQRCRSEAEQIAGDVARGDYLGTARRARLNDFIESWRDREDLDLVVVTRASAAIASADDDDVAGGAVLDEARALAEELVAEAVERGESATRVDYLGSGLLIHAAAPIPNKPRSAVSVAIYLPPELAVRLEKISSANADYGQFRAQRREMIALYLSLIALIFLATVFGATWMGFYLSRRITGPVQEVADASREISAGNLDVRVQADSGDEIGTLVEAFNEMAAQLQESQRVITRSTAELRESNRALDERRRYIETLVANLSTSVVSLDDKGRVTTANPAVEPLLNVPLVSGDDVRAKLRAVGLRPLRDLLDEVIESAIEEVRRNLVIEPRGEPVPVSVQISTLRGRGAEKLGILVMVEDLTDLLHAQRAVAWREVARRIAHEIKNPLTPIQLAAQRLRKKFEERSPDLPEIVPQATASIEKEVGALKTLVDEFSRFARMPEVSPKSVDIAQVVDSAIALYSGLPGVRWEVETDPEVGEVNVDPEQMRRALINLIDNALSAMDEEGTVRIVTRAHAGPGSLRIEVSDSGPGIPVGDRAKMFVPYFSTKKRGTGLGLAIVHRVVTDHKGSIRVEDNQPRGARFVIEIPA